MTAAGIRAFPSPGLVSLLGLLMVMPSSTLLADAQSDGERGISLYRQGNLIESMHLLNAAAEKGYAPAQAVLAHIYDQSEEDEKAVSLYQEAASVKNPEGLFGLGSMYLKGEGVAKDPRRAAELILEAATLSHSPAMRVVAHAYESGLMGLVVNQAEALRWYTGAAEAGDHTSIQRLIRAYGQGELGLGVDPAQAQHWTTQLTADKD